MASDKRGTVSDMQGADQSPKRSQPGLSQSEERRRMMSRVGSMRRASLESTSSSKTANSLRNTVGKLRGKLAKKKEMDGRGHASALNYLEEADQLRHCYEAEIFQLRECSLKDERHCLSLQDQIAEKQYLLRKSEIANRDLQARIDEQAALFKQNELNLEKQLVDLSQTHQRLVERYQELDNIKTSLEEKLFRLGGELDGCRSTIQSLHGEVRDVKHAASAIEDALKKAISIARRENYDLRALHTRQEKELADRLDQLQIELQDVVARIDQSLLPDREKLAVAKDFDGSLELLSLEYRNLLENCRLRVSRFNDSLLPVSSLHSNLPRHIKDLLLKRAPEALVQLIDTLSFETNVLQYLEALFPPADLSFLRKKYPHTPSAAMMQGEVFAQHSESSTAAAGAGGGGGSGEGGGAQFTPGTLHLAAGLAGREQQADAADGAKYLTQEVTA